VVAFKGNFPGHYQRSSHGHISTSVNWAANLVISATFLQTVQLLLNTLLTIVSTFFILSAVPKTKNKTLHRITKGLNSTTFRERMIRNFSQISCFSIRMLRPNLSIYSQLSNETGISSQQILEIETL